MPYQSNFSVLSCQPVEVIKHKYTDSANTGFDIVVESERETCARAAIFLMF